MDVNFLKKHNSDAEKIINEAIFTMKTYKLIRIAEILELNSGTIHNWITKKSSLSASRATEILLQLSSKKNTKKQFNNFDKNQKK